MNRYTACPESVRPHRGPRLEVAYLAYLIILGWLGVGQFAAIAESSPVRRTIDLGTTGEWTFQTNGAPSDAWKRVTVPCCFEESEGTAFDGVGWYRCRVAARNIPRGDYLLLQFDAAATEAEVWVNGTRVGSHLGGWTPFRFEVGSLLRRRPGEADNEILVRLDEKVGHNTQGFLPIVQPHFGGLWQRVSLGAVRDLFIDDLRLRAIGNPATGRIELELPVAGPATASLAGIRVTWRLASQGAITGQQTLLFSQDFESDDRSGSVRRVGDLVHAEIAIPNPRIWSPKAPNLYRLSIELLQPAWTAKSVEAVDRIEATAAFRTVETSGDQLRLNGAPLNVRGVLNWGYYPPRLAPFVDERRFRRDLEFARSRGFNLMKFCLWVPPRRYLELCDETGMLAWVEYPTWHPQLTERFMDPLRREFAEFFAFDRNHPSVVLRSLTCETGAGADLQVIRSLYDLAHLMIPGAVIEDDSSWIEWNRISDIYDDHPYGNNQTWVPTLHRLRDYAQEHGPKPLVLGEAIAADTWVPREPLSKRLAGRRPYWAPAGFDRQTEWLANRRSADDLGGSDTLTADSLRYGWLMRKYQIETYRREVPHGGYVVSVLRDFPAASMGLIDYLDQPKWKVRDWSWHGDTVCLLSTESDRRGFNASTGLRGEVSVSHFGARVLPESELTLTFRPDGAARGLAQTRRASLGAIPAGVMRTGMTFDFPIPPIDRPRTARLRAELKAGREKFTNEWTLWILPPPATWMTADFLAHVESTNQVGIALHPVGDRGPAVRVVQRLDEETVRALEQGARVVLLPDGGERSLRLADHWFLRGAPWVARHPLAQHVPHAFFVDLQAFDLAGEVMPDFPLLDQVDPILCLWDTHDHGGVKTHALCFETRVGEGRLLVSSLRHQGADNAAGRWLLDELVRHMASGPAPEHRLEDSVWQALKTKLREQRMSLTGLAWRFRPDPQKSGLEQGWANTDFDDSGWDQIQVGKPWDSQGYRDLDGWAWYRLKIEVPNRWSNQHVYLSFEGVDDCYELYVDGQLVARRGDPVRRIDTFNERFSHELTDRLQPGSSHVLAVRVFDWYGAGGIFRPVTLSTAPHLPVTEILK